MGKFPGHKKKKPLDSQVCSEALANTGTDGTCQDRADSHRSRSFRHPFIQAFTNQVSVYQAPTINQTFFGFGHLGAMATEKTILIDSTF